MAKAPKPVTPAAAKKSKRAASAAPTLDAETLTQMVTEVIHRSYANWADEAIPALDGKTPRQAVQTSAGRERVKGLLRSYEVSEAAQAGQQGRTAVSYDFLWQALELAR
jgi:hypothetical protein